jgi:hypothetical protein
MAKMEFPERLDLEVLAGEWQHTATEVGGELREPPFSVRWNFSKTGFAQLIISDSPGGIANAPLEFRMETAGGFPVMTMHGTPTYEVLSFCGKMMSVRCIETGILRHFEKQARC